MRAYAMRQCPFCGISVLKTAMQCPACREALPAEKAVRKVARPARKSTSLRRGLLYMLLAGVIQYFSGGYSPMHVPLAVSSIVTTYLAPLLFLSGLGMTLYGVFYADRTRLLGAN